jgi:hypothetical protein
VLCTLNTSTGVCTQVGVLGEFIASIAFTNTGQLYALSGKGGVIPSTLYTVNKATAALTVLLTLGNGDSGEAIGFNSNNGLMYHLSGFSTVFYETINLTTLAVTPIAHSLPQEESLAMAFDPVANDFFVSVNVGYKVTKVSLTGVQTVIGAPRPAQLAKVKGLAVVPSTIPPFIQTSAPNINLGTTTQGTSSTAVSFTVQGSNLTGDLTVTSPAPVVVSTAGPTSGFGSSVSLVPTAGAVPATTIYVRIQASAPQGPVSVNIACASTGATSVDVAASGQVDPPPATPEMDVFNGATGIADGGTDALGAFLVGTSQTVTYEIRNTSTVNLLLTGTPLVALGASNNVQNVSLTALPATPVVPSGSTSFTVAFEVVAVGPFAFALSIANNDPNENPYDWTAAGTGSPTPTFPEVDVFRSSAPIADGATDDIAGAPLGARSLTYTISNTGTGPLNITTPISIGATTNCSVTVTSQPAATVAAAGATTLAISATPAAAGAFSFSVSFDNDDSDENPFNFNVSGTATKPPSSTGGGTSGTTGCSSHSADWIWLMAILAAALVSARIVAKRNRA